MRIKQVLLGLFFLGVLGTPFIGMAASDFSSFVSINPIILPTSPFYFVKEWKRAIIRNFTPDLISKIVFTIDTLDEKALEIKKIDQIIPADYFGIKKSLDNYVNAQEDLKTQIENISTIRNERDREVLSKKIFERLVTHNKFFDSLLKKYVKNDEINKKIISIKNTILDTEIKVSEKISEDKIQPILHELFNSSSSVENGVFDNNIQILQEMSAIAPEKLKQSLQIFEYTIKKDKIMDTSTSSLNVDITTSTKGVEKSEVCLTVYTPVCGKDGKTYSNSCIATSLGVEIKENGECKK